MKEILSEFGLQGVSHRSEASENTCVSVHVPGFMCVSAVSASCHALFESHLSVLKPWFHSDSDC